MCVQLIYTNCITSLCCSIHHTHISASSSLMLLSFYHEASISQSFHNCLSSVCRMAAAGAISSLLSFACPALHKFFAFPFPCKINLVYFWIGDAIMYSMTHDVVMLPITGYNCWWDRNCQNDSLIFKPPPCLWFTLYHLVWLNHIDLGFASYSWYENSLHILII